MRRTAWRVAIVTVAFCDELGVMLESVMAELMP